MINTKKRDADNSSDLEEPLKKRSFKLEDYDGREDNKTKKFGKPTKVGAVRSGESKFLKTNKYKDKADNKFAGKFGNKFTTSKTNKYSGKSNIDGKREARNGEQQETEKTDWRKFKQDKKDLKLKRKQSKSIYEISVEAKKIYEKLKCRKTEKKSELVEKLYNMFKSGDTIKKLVMAHDTARIIQCMLKFAAPSLREQLSESLMPYAVEMSISKYAHFCVMRMFKYGSPVTKSKLVDSFIGNIVKLASHNISSKILDHVYLTVANSKQKSYMRQEFYGDLYRKAKDDNVKCLSDCYKETPNMKASILSSVKANLEHISNKKLVDSSLVHAVMLEYVKEMEEDKVEETVTMFASLITLMLTTREGCQAAIICFYKSSARNRRAIIKNIKEHLVKICTHEHGHIFAIAVLNALDDTKATKKAIYDTIHPELEVLMANQWGRRVIQWFISPGDKNCFHPTFIAAMDEGLQYGKKDKNMRRKEIFDQIENPIATSIAENPEFWLSNKHIGLVTAEILKNLSPANFVIAATSLAKIIARADWRVRIDEESEDKKFKKPQNVENIITEATKLKSKQRKQVQNISQNEEESEAEHDENSETEGKDTSTTTVLGIEEAGLHIILKKIIKNDKERLAKNNNCETFSKFLIQELTDEAVKSWLCINRACFILLNIVENNSCNIQEQAKALIQPYAVLLEEQKFNGAQLLQKKLLA